MTVRVQFDHWMTNERRYRTIKWRQWWAKSGPSHALSPRPASDRRITTSTKRLTNAGLQNYASPRREGGLSIMPCGLAQTHIYWDDVPSWFRACGRSVNIWCIELTCHPHDCTCLRKIGDTCWWKPLSAASCVPCCPPWMIWHQLVCLGRKEEKMFCMFSVFVVDLVMMV